MLPSCGGQQAIMDQQSRQGGEREEVRSDSIPKIDPIIYAAVKEAAMKGFVLIEQPYSPVDSFGLKWSFTDRDTRLPLRLGFRLDGGILTNKGALQPWKHDLEFQQKAPGYFWVNGEVSDTCRIRSMAGEWSTGRVTGRDASYFFVYINDSLSTPSFTRFPKEERLLNGPTVTVLITQNANKEEGEDFTPYLFTGEAELEEMIMQTEGELYGGATFSTSAVSGTIRLHLEEIIAQSETKAWRSFLIPPVKFVPDQ